MQQGTARRILEERMKRGQKMHEQRIEEIKEEVRRNTIEAMLMLLQPKIEKQRKEIKKLEKQIKDLKAKRK